MTRPIDVNRLANLLSADSELDAIERSLKRGGDRRTANRVADVRQILARALAEEQTGLYEALANPG